MKKKRPVLKKRRKRVKTSHRLAGGPAPDARTLAMVDSYKAGGSCAAVGYMFGVSMQRVNIAVHRHAPEAMRPHGSIAGVKRGPYRKKGDPLNNARRS